MAYDNTNTGILSRNTKRRSEKSSEFSGNINVEGVEYWLDAWVKERKADGSKFFSLALKRKDGQQAKSNAPLSEQLSDEIPF